jgi:hypothetical protein
MKRSHWVALLAGMAVGLLLPRPWKDLVLRESWNDQLQTHHRTVHFHVGYDPDLKHLKQMSSGGDFKGETVWVVTCRTKAEMDSVAAKIREVIQP